MGRSGILIAGSENGGSDIPARSRSRGTFTAVLGDVLLGMSTGLLAYYALTALVGGGGQAGLRAEAEWAGAPVAEAGPLLDFEGWAEEDRAYWDSLQAGGAFGRIVCEAMGLDAMVVKGSEPADLRRGPGWVEWTDPPGPTGNAGIAGHRTTYGAPFRRIDDVREGDVIEFYSPFRRYRYRVERTEVVPPSRGSVMAHTEEPRLTLSACHPPFSARSRFIVHSRLVEVSRLVGEEGS
ncbi:MAG: class E sortase [Coriobacteriia bacterium]|nr:class E sortase [Coriobacteriia bacterium]